MNAGSTTSTIVTHGRQMEQTLLSGRCSLPCFLAPLCQVLANHWYISSKINPIMAVLFNFLLRFCLTFFCFVFYLPCPNPSQHFLIGVYPSLLGCRPQSGFICNPKCNPSNPLLWAEKYEKTHLYIYIIFFNQRGKPPILLYKKIQSRGGLNWASRNRNTEI